MFGRKFAELSCAAILILATPGLAAAESLRDSLRNAYKNSGILVQNRALLRAADEKVADAVAALRPVISWSSRFAHAYNGPANTDSLVTSLNAEWLLYDFGSSDLQADALKETVLATRQSLVAIEQNVLLRAATAHVTYRRSVEFVSLRSANVELIEQELRAAQDRFDVGEVTRTDVALAEARLASARASLASAQGELAKAAAEYHAVVGRKPGDLVTPSSLPELPRDVSSAISTARSHHPDLIRVQHEVVAAELVLKASQLAYRPRLEAGAGLSNVDLDGELTRSLSLTLSGPVYSGGAIASASRAAIAQRDATRAQLHVAGLEVEQTVRNAFVVLEVARSTGEATDRQIEAASVAFRGVREEASLGARTTLDVLNAEQELLDARVSRISTQIDEQIASYSLLAAMGKLTATELDLGVKTYDPGEYYNLVKSAPRAKSKQGAALDRVLKGLAGN
ncbi:TolC family outer membrane protein [Planktomarina sp.]|jgi:outer membrane protein|nr:TolC family outer membrane protein [Planktomarina sp.]MDB4841656.1 TolC family outer membrane protein [Planktomarina sp.]